MLKKILQNNFYTLLLVVVGYLLIHSINNALTGFLYLVPGAHLVHIPSGFKLLFVLVAGSLGAIGVVIASLIASVVYKFPGEYSLGLQLAMVNGLAPFLARRWAIDNYDMRDDLSHITVKQLLVMGLAFAFLNSGLNQAVLYWDGVQPHFLDGLVVMLIGDITGAYIVFVLFKLLTKKLANTDESEKS